MTIQQDTEVGADLEEVDREAIEQFLEEYGYPALAPVTVVIAAFNEEKALGGVLKAMPDEVWALPVDVIVVSDGSKDGTAEVAVRAGAYVCDVPVNRGQGAALRLGYALARRGGATFVATLDADGQYDPAELRRVLEPLVVGEADFVTGSRRLGASYSPGALRRAGVVIFARAIGLLTGQRITDPANGLRAMRAEVTGAVRLEQHQYQAAELLIGTLQRGFRVAEVPTTMFRRTAGRSKKGRNLAYGWRFGKVVARTWWRDRGLEPVELEPLTV